MPYRRTESVVRRLAARHEAIVDAAEQAASDGGMAAIQIALVAERAGIAAGTVYRYFPGKTDLVGALMARVSESALRAVRQAANAAPGPLSALAASLTTFGMQMMRERKLAWAVLGEPVDGEIDVLRMEYRSAFADEVARRIGAAVAAGHLPEINAALASPAIIGAMVEGLIGPLAPNLTDPAQVRSAIQTLALIALRGLGVVDARARGLVVQTAWTAPSTDRRVEAEAMN